MTRLSPQLTATELARLTYAPDAAIRAEVAAHPNTPADLLGRLGAEFPAEVLANPALPLLRLAEPRLLASWPTKTIERLTAEPDAPDWLLRLAARNPVIDVQLAAVVHAQLPPDVLEQLAASPFWTIREYVARKPQLPPPLLEQLACDPDYGVRITVAGRTDLTPTALAHLRSDQHPLVRSVILLQHAQAD